MAFKENYGPVRVDWGQRDERKSMEDDTEIPLYICDDVPINTGTYQVDGDHYKKMGIQPKDYIVANKLDWFEGNIIKYVTRHRAKGGRKDIEKLIHYAQMILENDYPQ